MPSAPAELSVVVEAGSWLEVPPVLVTSPSALTGYLLSVPGAVVGSVTVLGSKLEVPPEDCTEPSIEFTPVGRWREV